MAITRVKKPDPKDPTKIVWVYKDDKDKNIRWIEDTSGKVLDGSKPTGYKYIPVPTSPVDKEGTLYKAQTEEGRITPTGKNSDSPFGSVKEQLDWYKQWGIENPKLNNADTQGQIYDKADPYWKAAMWGSYGDTKKGATKKTYPEWVYKKGEKLSEYKTRMQTAGWTPEKIKEETDKLKPNFTDTFSGPREAWLAAKLQEEETPVAIPKEAKATDIIPDHNQQYSNDTAYAPFWLQDTINTASAAGTRAGLKKYLPWAPQVELQTPRPTFFDPTRELANNTEQMQIGTEGAGMFAGPQAFNSRFAGIQGQGAKNAANILANYHNKNVGVANTFENLRADIYNRNNQGNAAVAQKLYDGTTIANQQFDNSKRKANAELRESYINALTNRGKTQTLNSIYPHYQVHPETGGLTTFDGGSDIEATNYQDKAKQFYELMNDPRMDAETARAIVGISGDGRSSNPKSDYFNSYLDSAPKSKYGGESEDSYLDSYRKMKSIFK